MLRLTLGDVASIRLGGGANPTGDGELGARNRDAVASFSIGQFRTWHWGALFHHRFADRLYGVQCDVKCCTLQSTGKTGFGPNVWTGC